MASAMYQSTRGGARRRGGAEGVALRADCGRKVWLPVADGDLGAAGGGIRWSSRHLDLTGSPDDPAREWPRLTTY